MLRSRTIKEMSPPALLVGPTRWARKAGAEDLGGAAVGFAHPCGVDAQGGGASTAVAEAASDGPQVNTGADEFGCRVVAQGMQVTVDPDPGTHPGVAVADRVGAARPVV